MVPDITGTGHSFQGAMAYYLHDKAEGGGSDRAHPTTADRVAWTETRNMMDVGPHTATRIMIATAQQADQLKAAAGVKNTGRKSTAHVYAYSLAWHPDEAGKLDKAEMLRAADASLKVLGAGEHQAVIVCHTDQKHPHVHVIVNRVHPDTGKMLTTSNDRRKLSEWANQYERERGQILTPKREEKRQIREQFDEVRRKEFVEQRRKLADTARSEPQKPVQASGATYAPSDLKELSDAQKARHKAEWPALSEKHRKTKDAIYSEYGGKIKAASAAHKEAMRPYWREQFRRERDERRQFDRDERTISGVVKNALHAALHQQAQGQNGGRGLLSATFANVLSSQARSFALAEKQQMKRDQLHAEMKRVLDREVSGLKEQRGAALQGQREAFGKERLALIERQNVERAKVREAWRQIYERRGAATVPNPTYRRNQWQAQRSAAKEHRAQQEQPPRRSIGLQADQQQKGIERKTRMMEPKPMQPREAFEKAQQHQQKQEQAAKDRARAEQLAKAKQEQTERRFVSSPAPSPSPAGTPPMPARKEQHIPKKPDPSQQVKVAPVPAKDWRKIVQAPEPKKAQPAPATRPAWEKLSKDAQKAVGEARRNTGPTVGKDWKAAAPSKAAPEPERKSETLASKWESRAKDEPKLTFKQDRKKDRDFDRER